MSIFFKSLRCLFGHDWARPPRSTPNEMIGWGGTKRCRRCGYLIPGLIAPKAPRQ